MNWGFAATAASKPNLSRRPEYFGIHSRSWLSLSSTATVTPLKRS